MNNKTCGNIIHQQTPRQQNENLPKRPLCGKRHSQTPRREMGCGGKEMVRIRQQASALCPAPLYERLQTPNQRAIPIHARHALNQQSSKLNTKKAH